MKYNPKKVAELIADRKKDELEKALQPRLRKIAKIVSKVKYGLGVKGTVGYDFAYYIYAHRGKISFTDFLIFTGQNDLLLHFHTKEYLQGIYFIKMPVEFATCEDKDLKGVVITQIRDDLYRHVDKLEKEFNKARNIRNKFTVEYDGFINTKE